MTATVQLQRLQDDKADLRAQISGLVEERASIIRSLTNPFTHLEGAIAFFVFGVFFMASIAARTHYYDPEFDYSLNQNDLNQHQWLRLRKLLVIEFSKSMLRHHEHMIRKSRDKAQTESSTVEEAKAKSLKAQKEAAITRLNENKNDAASYVHRRCTTFASVLGRFRRSKVQQIEAFLARVRPRNADGEPA